MHKYEIVIYWSNEDGAYVAEAPELPGCMAHADTQEAALEHVGRHLDAGEDASFVHDHSLRDREEPNGGSKETEADELAEEALVPKAAWDASEAARHPSGMAVMALASDLDIHPAIVVGRVRYKLDNYRLLSQFVGSGQVRRQFESV